MDREGKSAAQSHAQRRRAVDPGDRTVCHGRVGFVSRSDGNVSGSLYLSLRLRSCAGRNPLCHGAGILVFRLICVSGAAFRCAELCARAGLSGHRSCQRDSDHNMAHDRIELHAVVFTLQQSGKLRSGNGAISIPVVHSVCALQHSTVDQHIEDGDLPIKTGLREFIPVHSGQSTPLPPRPFAHSAWRA
jgi:hypothetical protein